MTDRPILFSAPMVRALLAGRKTQTRRALNPQPLPFAEAIEVAPYRGYGRPGVLIARTLDDVRQMPCGRVRFRPGDRLWVKETYRFEARWDDARPSEVRVGSPVYPETAPYEPTPECAGICRPSIFMPRWASRLTLIVTDVRVERLQEISEDDAIAEGISFDTIPDGLIPGGHTSFGFPGYSGFPTAVSAYQSLWDSINGAGAWEANPWVVAVSFQVEQRNIDAGEDR